VVIQLIKLFLQDYLIAMLVGCFLINYNVLAEENAVNKQAVAVFAGGCFWCMELPYDEVPGVISTISGYTGGHTENPTYKEVSNGKTGHLEAIQITYDPAKVSYEKLLDVYWHNIDPLDGDGQFCDKGDQYKSAIFYQDENEKQLAEASKLGLKGKFPDKVIVTSIKVAGTFFPAEEYHQDYYLNNPTKYKFYRFTCGRDKRLNELWGD
jgi:peptide-methionine (S)-S-oxide reductase